MAKIAPGRNSATPFPSTPQELAAFQDVDTARWAEIVETAKIEKK